MKKIDHDKIYIEFEDTLVQQNKSAPIIERKPNFDLVKCMDLIKKKGLDIIIVSIPPANEKKDKTHYVREIRQWLKKYRIPFNDIIVIENSLIANIHGRKTRFINDNNMHTEEFSFKYSGPYSNYNFDMIIDFYNDEAVVEHVHTNSVKAERFLHIKNYIYINNGSTDRTLMKLTDLALNNPKIKIIDIQENIGFGNGYKAGFIASDADFIITNISDSQFDIYTYIYTNMRDLKEINANEYNIFSERKCRSFSDSFASSFLRFILTLLSFRKIRDFKGHPKIINKNDITVDINSLPNDDNFDLKLFMSIPDDKIVFLPIIQKESYSGKMSWDLSLKEKFNLFIKFVKFAIDN